MGATKKLFMGLQESNITELNDMGLTMAEQDSLDNYLNSPEYKKWLKKLEANPYLETDKENEK